VAFLWGQVSQGVSAIAHDGGFFMQLTWVTVRVAIVSTAAAVVLGLPLGLMIGLGRFRGRRALHLLANAGLALPPVVVGVVVLLLLVPQGPFGSLRIEFTLTAVYVVQAILALPYVIALSAAAFQALPGGLLGQARALGAGRAQLWALALREAWVGVLVAAIAAVGAAISEVGAVIIVGANEVGHTQLLASALLADFSYGGDNPTEAGIAIVLTIVTLVLLGILSTVQQRAGGIRLRFTES
jgi:tungstate transport system permease protein